MRIFNLGAWNLAGICINTFHNYLPIFVKFDDVIKKLWTKNSEFSMDYVTKHYVIVVQYLLLKLTSQWLHWICLFIDTKYNIGCHRKFRVNPVFVETILISLLHNREIEKATSAQITIERRGGKRIFFFCRSHYTRLPNNCKFDRTMCTPDSMESEVFKIAL